MLFSVVLVIFVLLIIFIINEPVCQPRNTTSTALQEIWSGSCARRCLNSQTYRIVGGYSYQVPDYNNCSCDICTCALSGNPIRTCNQVTTTLNTTMASFNEIVQNVYETVRATYDYLFEVVQGMLNQNQMSEEGNLINVTDTSGSEETIVVTRPEPEPVSVVAPKVEQIVNENASIKPTGEGGKTSPQNNKNSQLDPQPPGKLPATEPGEAKDTLAVKNNPLSMAIVGIEPKKQEMGTEAQRLTVETTSPKCTRCIEKNVFCNQDCPNTTNVDRID